MSIGPMDVVMVGPYHCFVKMPATVPFQLLS